MLGFIIGLIQIILYTFSGILNPGLPKLEYEKLIYEDVSNKNFRQCKDCKFWINTEFSTQHCNECNVCIEGYDHHCNTLNLCIGKDNLKNILFLYFNFFYIFNLFLNWIFITFINYKNNLIFPKKEFEYFFILNKNLKTK